MRNVISEQFSKITHTLSDKELNRVIYQHAKDAVEAGVMPPWPEDDFGVVMWFTWNFITDEMRESFPAIAKEYLAHYRDEDKFREKAPGQGAGIGGTGGAAVKQGKLAVGAWFPGNSRTCRTLA